MSDRVSGIRAIVNGPNYYHNGQFWSSNEQDARLLGDALLLLQECTALLDAQPQGGPRGDVDRTQCASCEHKFCNRCDEDNECCKCGRERPIRTVTERLAQHEHIDIVEGVLGGVNPLVSRTRISVHHILSYLYNGNSIEYIAENYNLTAEAIKDAIAFAQDVYDDVIDRELRQPDPAESARVAGESATKTIDWLGDMEVRRVEPCSDSARRAAEGLAIDAIEDVLEYPRTADANTYAVAKAQLAALKLVDSRTAAPADHNTVQQARSTLARELIEAVRQHVGSCPGDTQLRLLSALRAKCEELGVRLTA